MAAGNFGGGVTISVDANDNATFTAIGEVLSINPPGQEYPMVDFTVLGDTVQQMFPSPTMNAPEWDVTVLLDRTEAEQPEIDGIVGDSTFHSWKIDFPWATVDEVDMEACVKSVSYGEVTNDGRLEATYSMINNTVNTWS